MRRLAFLLLILCLFALRCIADDQEHHHEDLTAAQLGTVHFPVSCAPGVQKPFDRGVALLHSFWYEEAEKQFLQIAKDDPGCAVAHWGVAMSLWHQLWNHPDQKVIKRGKEEVHRAKKGNATARERAYVAAIDAFYKSKKTKYDGRAKAYSDGMKKVYESYDDDPEAAAFYALSLLARESDGDEAVANRKAAAAVLEKLFAIMPDHPGVAHYLIHTYDTSEMAQLGLPAARHYAQIAPDAPHALHMPSHIFARMGLSEDDINSNLASIAATRKTAAMHMGGEGHQFHAMDFLVYAYLQSGRESDAQKVIDEVKAMPAMQDMYGMGFDPRAFSLTVFEASYALELHHWEEAASLPIVPSPDTEIHARTYLARAIGAARSGQLAEARKDIDEIGSISKALLEKHKKDEADYVDGPRQQALAWIRHAEGKDDEAVKILRLLADKEKDGLSGAGDLPVHEMLADLLLEAKRPQEALAEYQIDLKLSPNRFNGLYGAALAAEAAGEQSEATEYYSQLLRSCEGSSSARPELGRARTLVAKK